MSMSTAEARERARSIAANLTRELRALEHESGLQVARVDFAREHLMGGAQPLLYTELELTLRVMR